MVHFWLVVAAFYGKKGAFIQLCTGRWCDEHSIQAGNTHLTPALGAGTFLFLFKEDLRGVLSHPVLCSYMEVSWLSPAVASAPGHSCPSWQLSDGFLIQLFWGLSATCSRQREAFLPGAWWVKPLCASLLWHKGFGVCVCVERGAGSGGACGIQAAHLSPCHGVLLACLVCATCSKFCLPAFGAKAVWSHASVLGSLSPRPRSGQHRVLVIIHICFRKTTVFSGTGHGDGAIRNSQQSSHIARVISLNSMFTFATGFQSTKTF